MKVLRLETVLLSSCHEACNVTGKCQNQSRTSKYQAQRLLYVFVSHLLRITFTLQLRFLSVNNSNGQFLLASNRKQAVKYLLCDMKSSITRRKRMGLKKRETQNTVHADQKIPYLINGFGIIFFSWNLFFFFPCEV